MKRGEVYWAELTPRSGSEQTGRRPVVLMSHDAFNGAVGWNCLIVVPLSTSTSRAHRGPTAVPIPSGTAGLARNGIALCHQVTTLDRSKLNKKIGIVPPGILAELESGLRAALDLD